MKIFLYVFLIIFFSFSSYAENKSEIKFGDFLTEDQLNEIDFLHKGLSNYSSIKNQNKKIYDALDGVFPDVYSWYHRDLGFQVKKTIQVLRGTNQVIVHETELIDPECIKFIEYVNHYFKYLGYEDIKDINYFINGRGTWYKWSQEARLQVYIPEGLPEAFEDFFSNDPNIDLNQSTNLKCDYDDGLTTFTEFGHLSADEKDNFLGYIKYMQDFPIPEPFGLKLFNSMKTNQIINEIDVGQAEIKVKKQSEYFEKYWVNFIPDENKTILSIVGEYDGKDSAKKFIEVKRLIKKKYKRFMFITLDTNESLIGYNAKWRIKLFLDLKTKNNYFIDYAVRNDYAVYKREDLIDDIKSDSL